MAKNTNDVHFLVDQTDDSNVYSEDEGELQNKIKKFDSKRNAVIFLLDARKKMFSEDELTEDGTIFVQCLKCIRNAIRAKIHALENSLCSVLLLGTEKSENQVNLKNIFVVQPLKILQADHILKIDEIIKEVEDSSYCKHYGWSNFSLGDAFWLCFRMFFDYAKSRVLNKRIILFTNDDNPADNDRNEFDRIISCADDMLHNNILLELIYMGENFDVTKIYKEVIQLSRGDMDYEIPEPVANMKEMIKRANRIDFRHVSLSKIPFFVAGDFKCEVSVHYLVRKVKAPFQIKLSKATNDRVETKKQWFEMETGQVIPKEDLVRSYKIAGKEIIFTMKELKYINSFCEVGLRLMGFKPASTVSLEHYIKPCAFIFPSDPKDIDQSTFFMALLSSCLERQVVPICTFCPRSTSSLHYVALIAIEEELAPNRTQLCPTGFLVFFLPFAEEVRDLDEKCCGKKRASPEDVEIAKKLIKKLKFNYQPDMFPNPKLAAHWSAIEALALDLKEPEPYADLTLPNYDLMKQRTAAVIEEFKNAIYTDNYDPELSELRKKVKPNKIAEAKKKDFKIDTNSVEEIIKSGEMRMLTNDMLKLYLQEVGQGKGVSKMKKSDLIEKACNYLKIPVSLI